MSPLLFKSLPVSVDNEDATAVTILPISAFPDKRLFEESAEFPVISVAVRDTANAKRRLNEWIPSKTKVVFPDGDARRKIVLLPTVSMKDVATRLAEAIVQSDNSDRPHNDSLKHEVRRKKQKHTGQKNTIGPIEFTIPTTEPTIRLIRSYDDQTADEILRKLLPASTTEIPTALEQVGHIAHLNLRTHLLPYQYWIGQILLDKHSYLKTVVNKTSSIATIYRTFPMQVIAGNDAPGWSITTVTEHNCVFQLDYKTVYWNSRLSGEHDRLVREIVQRGYNVVADCMAGVGPFAIPLAKKGLTVYANDLNAESIKYLEINKELNKIRMQNESSGLHVYNLDARDFVKKILPKQAIDCAILNLPASAPEFLDAFSDIDWSIHLYVYSFAPKDDSSKAVARCKAALGNRQLHDLSIHTVRDVSPGKNMYCISFRLSNKKVKTTSD